MGSELCSVLLNRQLKLGPGFMFSHKISYQVSLMGLVVNGPIGTHY